MYKSMRWQLMVGQLKLRKQTYTLQQLRYRRRNRVSGHNISLQSIELGYFFNNKWMQGKKISCYFDCFWDLLKKNTVSKHFWTQQKTKYFFSAHYHFWSMSIVRILANAICTHRSVFIPLCTIQFTCLFPSMCLERLSKVQSFPWQIQTIVGFSTKNALFHCSVGRKCFFSSLTW